MAGVGLVTKVDVVEGREASQNNERVQYDGMPSIAVVVEGCTNISGAVVLPLEGLVEAMRCPARAVCGK